MRSTLALILFVLLLAVLWETIGHMNSMTFILPPLTAVMRSLWVDRFLFWEHSLATLRIMCGGLLLALCVAVPVSCLMRAFKSVGRLLGPILIASQCLPIFAIAPLMLMWFGWGYVAILIPTSLMLFFPLCVAMNHGLQATPTEQLDLFRLAGATNWQTLWKLRLPYAWPHLCAGLRTSIGWAGMSAVVAEWVGAQKGIGILLLESRRSLDIAATFAAILVLFCLSVALFIGTFALERVLPTLQRRLRRIRGVGASLLCVCMLCSCGNTEKKQPVRLLLDWAPNPNHVALFAGIEEGYFSEEGIDLELLTLRDPSDTFPILSTKQADLAISYMPSVILAEQKNPGFSHVVGYLCKQPLNALCLRQCHLMRGAKELDRKVLGISTDGLQTRLLNFVLSTNHAQPKRICQLSLDPVAMLVSGHVDGLFGIFWNIECAHLSYLNVPCQYVPIQELGVPHYFELIIITQQGREYTEPEFVARFKRALQRSINFSQLNPTRAFTLYAQANPQKTSSSLEWEKLAWNRTYPILPSNQLEEPQVWADFSAWMEENDLMNKE